MSLSDDLRSECSAIFRGRWERRDGTVVPEPSDLKLGQNDAVDLDATILYADLVASTALVKSESGTFAAEVYKTYLHCACQIIKSCGGVITSFDGDRVMGIFIGGTQSSDATQCALHIKHAVQKIVQEELKGVYKDKTYVVEHVVGIDRSKILATRTGVRGDNDIVWVGNAANRAAKLCAARLGYKTLITADVYSGLEDASKFSGPANMWTAISWPETGEIIYGSNFSWAF